MFSLFSFISCFLTFSCSFGLHSSEPQQKGKGPKRKPRIKFSSYDLIDWFCVNVPICHTRSDAVVLGNKLLEFQFILPCSPETLLFNDTDEMFEIADSVSTSVSGRTVLNLREGAPPKRGEEEEEEEESNPLTFSRDLLETIGAFFSQVPFFLFKQNGKDEFFQVTFSGFLSR